MASYVFDSAAMRELGAGASPYDVGRHGRIVCFSFAGVTNGLLFNVGPGAQIAGWENPDPAVSNHVGTNLLVDRVTFNTDGTRAGNLWVFYKNGCGDARGSSGGGTIAPTGVVEHSRRLQGSRLVVANVSAANTGETSALLLTGIRHLLTVPNTPTTGQIDGRFVSPADRAVGLVTWGTVGTPKNTRLVCIVAPGKGLTAAGI